MRATKRVRSLPLLYDNRAQQGKLLATRAMVTHVFDRTALERLIGEHTRLKRDWSAALWALLMFESWCARYQIGPDALE